MFGSTYELSEKVLKLKTESISQKFLTIYGKTCDTFLELLPISWK